MSSLPKSSPTVYSNPSWTMAIASRSSALSRWWGQRLSQVESFTLQLKGVSSQELSSSTSDSTDSNEESQSQPLAIVQGEQAQLEAFTQLTERYVQSLLSRTLVAVGAGVSKEEQSLEDAPADGLIPLAVVEPPSADPRVAFFNNPPVWDGESAYMHRLHFGGLQVEPLDLKSVTVTTSQLYDLAEILHQSLQGVQPLAQSHYARMLPERSPAWMKTAAVAVMALGFTGGVAWYVVGGASFQTASDPQSADEPIALNQPQGQSPNNGLNLPPNFPIKPPPFPSQPTESEKSSTSNSQGSPSAKKSQGLTQSQSPLADSEAEDLQSEESEANLPNQQKIASQSSNRKLDQASSGQNQQAEIAKAQKKVAPATPKVSQPAAKPSASPQPQKPEAIAEPKPPAPESFSVASAPQPATTARSQNAGAQPSAESLANDVAPSAALAPQPTVATVEQFFQGRWQGQDDLNQSLSYTIMVKPDGKVLSVTPKDEVSLDQLGQVPLPKLGQSLTPAFSASIPAAFSVTLFPDGSVAVKAE